MRIVHFTSGRVNPARAKVGSVNLVHGFADAQSRLGHDVEIWVVPTKRDYPNAESATYSITEFEPARMRGLALPSSLDVELKARPPDVVHLNGFYGLEHTSLARKLRRARIPYVVSSHGSFSPLILKHHRSLLKRSFRLLFGLPLLNGAAFVHLHADGERGDALSYGVKAPLVVAHQGVSMEAIPDELDRDWLDDRFPQRRGCHKFLFLGRLDPWHKGLDLLLDGFAQAREQIPTAVLFIAGPEKSRDSGYVPNRIEQLGLEESVITLGPLYAAEDKYGALMSADTFVLTSRFEGFPLTILEALSVGTPVLVTPGTNAADLVTRRQVGWVVEPAAAAIASGLAEAVARATDNAEMKRRAVDTAIEHTWESAARILLDAYRSIK